VPFGFSGELCLSGKGVSLGYINDTKLTSEKFTRNPFESNSVIYKTGDLVKRRKDGQIQFLGRIDNQVKINGFRIELTDVEKALLRYFKIENVAVIHRKENEFTYLHAYYVSNSKIFSNELKDFLILELPLYMIPSFFTAIKKIPLTLNGKIDYKSLINIEHLRTTYIAPKNDKEIQIVEIWSNILSLNKSKISINSSFFSLGGNSLKTILLVQKLKEEFSVEFSIRDIFLHDTIEKINDKIEEDLRAEQHFLLKELEEMSDKDLLDLLEE